MAGTLAPRRDSPLARFGEPRGFFEDMEHMLARLWEDGQMAWFGPRSIPSLDVSETDTAVEVKLDLPGMKAEEIEIQLNGNLLTISGERKEEEEEKGKTYHRVERRVGRFSRSLTLPCPVEEDEVAASYQEGVLNITLPKTEEAKTKKINVKG